MVISHLFFVQSDSYVLLGTQLAEITALFECPACRERYRDPVTSVFLFAVDDFLLLIARLQYPVRPHFLL